MGVNNNKRKPLVAGNWKMHLGGEAARSMLADLLLQLDATPAVEVGVVPPFTSLHIAAELLASAPVLLGAQNCHPEAKGAFTGEIAPGFLKELGCQFVLAGHSERRKLFGESDTFIGKKVRAIVNAGMTALLCVGETLEERDAGRLEAVVLGQLAAGLEGIRAAELAAIAIAYEPVWAIGTGRTASPGQAQEAHALIRSQLFRMYDREAAGIRILYGGSVKAQNAGAIMAEPDIDGLLVGGASLDPTEFAAIAAAAARARS